MFRFHDRYVITTCQKTCTTPDVRKLLDRSIEKSRQMRMIVASINKYQIFEGQAKFYINLNKIECSYGEW